jgi:hypothetical protein
VEEGRRTRWDLRRSNRSSSLSGCLPSPVNRFFGKWLGTLPVATTVQIRGGG